ncbi:hypothetical protein ACLB2K_065422 [Fragaria x ananassa]
MFAHLVHNDTIDKDVRSYFYLKTSSAYHFQKLGCKMYTALIVDGNLDEAAEFHNEIKETRIDPMVLIHTSVIKAYLKFGKTKGALEAYLAMLAAGVAPNSYTYTVLIKGLAADPNFFGDAKKYLLEMMDKGKRPNVATFTAVIEGFAKQEDKAAEEEGKAFVRVMMDKGFVPNAKAIMNVLKGRPTPKIDANYFNYGNVDGFKKTNISHILFGIGGSVNSWNTRKQYIELWWKPNITRGFVWFDQKPFPNMTWTEILPQYKVSGDKSRFNYTCWYDSRSTIRIARIVKESFELGLENIRWFVMGDDDTVFFTENLVTVLAKYDHNQMYYIGGNSESVEQDMVHSYATAYGGAGYLPWSSNNRECRHCNCTSALAVEFFNVSASRFSPDLRNKAPRRQCCEIINGSEGVDSVVQVQIRDCMRFESVTPP